MKTALDIATIAFMLTAAVGVVLLGRFMVLMLFRPHSIPSNPWPPELSSVSMAATTLALERARFNFFHATGKGKERLGYEVRRLEGRIAQLQLRVRDEQAPYRRIGLKRIEAWKQWRALRDELTGARKHERHDTRHLVLEAEKNYRRLDAQLQAEHLRYDARDRLLLEELIVQGVLKTEEELTQRAAGPGAHDRPTETAHAEAAQPDAQHAASADHDQGLGELPTGPGTPGQGPPNAESATPHDRPGAQAAAASAGQDPATLPEPAPTAQAFSEFDLYQREFADPQVSKQFKRYRDPTFDLSWAPGGLMSDVNLAGSFFTGVRFQGLHRYRRCDFERASLKRIVLSRQERPHQFAHCNFRAADFSGSHLAYMVFSDCDLARSRWQGAQLDLVKFVDCTVEGIDWSGVDLHRTVMSDDMLAACDFSGASHPPKNFVPPGAVAQGAPPDAIAGSERSRDAPSPAQGQAGAAATGSPPAPPAAIAARGAMPAPLAGPADAPTPPTLVGNSPPAPTAQPQAGAAPADDPP